VIPIPEPTPSNQQSKCESSFNNTPSERDEEQNAFKVTFVVAHVIIPQLEKGFFFK
jgi:hypothetical protein